MACRSAGSTTTVWERSRSACRERSRSARCTSSWNTRQSRGRSTSGSATGSRPRRTTGRSKRYSACLSTDHGFGPERLVTEDSPLGGVDASVQVARLRHQGFLRPGAGRRGARHARLFRHRRLRALGAGDHRALRREARRNRVRNERTPTDARLRTAAFRSVWFRCDFWRDDRGRAFWSAPPGGGGAARFRSRRENHGRARRSAFLRRAGHEERRGLRRVAPDGGVARHARNHPGNLAQGAASPRGRGDAQARTARGQGDRNAQQVGRQAPADQRERLDRRRARRAPLGRGCRRSRRAGKNRRRGRRRRARRALLDGDSRTDRSVFQERRAPVAHLGSVGHAAPQASRGAARRVGRGPALALLAGRLAHRPRGGEARRRPRHALSRRRQVGRRLSAARAGAHEDPQRAQARVRPARHLQPRPHVSGAVTESLMQTALADFIRDTPEGREADAILRKCVHCGFCTATCPTYLLLGDENDGPRGRIYLMKQALEGRGITDKTRLHLDRCLTCRACETTCPSGVQYGRLLDIGRKLVEEKTARPARENLKRRALAEILPRRSLFALLLKLGRLLRPLLPSRLAEKVPASTPAAGAWPAPRHARKMLALAGCVQPALSPDINAAAARVLDSIGISLIEAKGAGCCGGLRYHLNYQEDGLDDMRALIDSWWPHVENGVEAIVMTASGCGVTMKEYGHLLERDPRYAARAAKISALTRDISEVIDAEHARLEPLLGKNGGRVAFHPPCTLQNGQYIKGLTERVLALAGFELTPVPDSHLCCGSAGTYSILQPELSGQLKRNKLSALAAGSPEEILTANIGCLAHLQGGTGLPVRHWIVALEERLS